MDGFSAVREISVKSKDNAVTMVMCSGEASGKRECHSRHLDYGTGLLVMRCGTFN